MSKKILSVLCVGLLLFSCKDNTNESDQTQQTPEVSVVEEQATNTNDTRETVSSEPTTQTNVSQPQTVQPATTTPTNAGPFLTNQQQQAPAPTTGQTAPGWSGKPNPVHGQPGHRCDIPVGDILP